MDEQLIKEALHAYHGVEDRGQSWAWSAEAVEGMQAALAVFERAHTPTDDERELAQVIKDFWWECEAGSKPPKHLNGEPTAGDVALASSILATGYRRSEVPEPSADDVVVTLTPEAVEANREYIERTQGEPSDAQAERARIIADLREWSRPLGNLPEEETLRLVIERIERAAGVGGEER